MKLRGITSGKHRCSSCKGLFRDRETLRRHEEAHNKARLIKLCEGRRT